MDATVAEIAVASGPDPVPVVVKFRTRQGIGRRGATIEIVVEIRGLVRRPMP
jgi:hypothetical protein